MPPSSTDIHHVMPLKCAFPGNRTSSTQDMFKRKANAYIRHFLGRFVLMHF